MFKKPLGGGGGVSPTPFLQEGLIVNFMISIIVHLPLRGCPLRCHVFNEYNYQ